MIRKHGLLALFSMAILSVSAMAVWWAVFINRAINEQHAFHLQALRQGLAVLALKAGSDCRHVPITGPLQEDPRFAVSEQAAAAPASDAIALSPCWPGYHLYIRREAGAEIEKKFHARRLMIAGESVLMFLTMAVSMALLFQYVRLEKRTLREIETFWKRMTHELQTPAAGIKAFLQNLKNKTLPPADILKYTDLALLQVSRLEQLTGNLIASSMLRKSLRRLHLQAVDLGNFFKNYSTPQFLTLAGGRFSLSFSAPLPLVVRADPDALRIILDNLILNAVRHGSPEPQMDLRISAAGKLAHIAASDNGRGFNPSAREIIFRTFDQPADRLPSGSHGAGVGLFFSRQLAREMGGDLEAFSPGAGRGATFTLTLPLNS
jgi:signal transduction histidine kinase